MTNVVDINSRKEPTTAEEASRVLTEFIFELEAGGFSEDFIATQSENLVNLIQAYQPTIISQYIE